jgi:hypothetical protein
MEDLKKLIREVPDFPKAGILFYDITTLLRDKDGLHKVIDRMTEQIAPLKPDYVMGLKLADSSSHPRLPTSLERDLSRFANRRNSRAHASGLPTTSNTVLTLLKCTRARSRMERAW